MKKTLSLLALSLAAALPQAHAAVVTLDVIPPVTAGSPFDVRVELTDVFNGRDPGATLVAYGFNVTVGSPAVVSYQGEDSGPLFDDVSFLFGGTPMVAGFATAAAGVGPTDFTEPLVIAILHFSALKNGTSTIGVTWDPTDANQGLFFSDSQPQAPISSRTSVSLSAVPEPGGLSLCALALAGVCFLALRRREA
jgi:hypothetical protein